MTGLAGAGKTSVLAAAARGAAADGFQVVGTACQASDQGLGFGALLDLLADVPGSGDVLPRVLPRASGPDSAGPDPLRLRLDLLTWLAEVGAEQPLLLVVDDVQWCDESSLSVISFLTRRLASTRVSLLAGVRGTAPTALKQSHRVELAPLTRAQAFAVLRQAGLTMDGDSSESVVELAEGNPLALLEFGREVVRGGSPGTIPPSVETVFTGQVAALPAPTRRMLLLTAACGGRLAVLGRVFDVPSMTDDLAPAEAAGLVTVDERTVHFRHPLARAAAYACSTAADRIRAHELLAAAHSDDPARQIWHRAEATIAPDESVAEGLAEAAEWSRTQGAGAEAARLMSRAAELTVAPAVREERELAAVLLHAAAGNFDITIDLAQRLRDHAENPSVRSQAGHQVAYALTQIGRHTAARNAVEEALEPLMAEQDSTQAWSLLTTLAALAYRANEPAEVVAYWLDRFDRELGESSVPEVTAAARAWIRVQVDPLDVPAPIVDLVRTAPVPDNYPLELVSSHEMLLGAAAWLLGDTPVALTRLTRAVDLMRRADAPGQISPTLISLAMVQIEAGAYDDAEATARLVIDLADTRGINPDASNGRDLLARVAALRGDVGRARELCDRVLLDLHLGEHFALEASVRTAMSWVRTAEGDAQGAWDEVRWLFTHDGDAKHPHVCYKDLCHFVAAAMRAGAINQAEQIVEAAGRRLTRAGTPFQLQLARARSLVLGEDAEPWYRRAVDDPVAAQRPFELARAQLEYGGWLRRRHRQTEARNQLQSALAGFERLGTPTWSDVATAELRAAGVATVSASGVEGAALSSLTGQEREIVRLAATGLTNKEIAASLQLSPKTVSTHLYNAFPKLGVSSRRQLRDVAGVSEPG